MPRQEIPICGFTTSGVVEKANGIKLIPGDYATGLPIIELFVKEHRVGGNDGCNQIGGSFTTNGNTISFSHLTGTKIACSGLDKGVQIGKLLGGITYQYLFEKNHLILKQVDKEVLVLKNID
jgi:heat shock protein HslJ